MANRAQEHAKPLEGKVRAAGVGEPKESDKDQDEFDRGKRSHAFARCQTEWKETELWIAGKVEKLSLRALGTFDGKFPRQVLSLSRLCKSKSH